MHRKDHDSEVRKSEDTVSREVDITDTKVSQIVKGVARKYGGQFGIDSNDLEQEVWLKLLEESNRSNPDKILNPRMTARISYNKAVDVYRKERRRWDSKADMVSDDNISKIAINIVTHKNHLMITNPFVSPEKALEIRELVDQFQRGTKERKFLVMKAYIEGVLEMEEVTELEPSIDPGRLAMMEDSEHRMARELGWSGSGSGSYRKLKKSVRRIISTYFGES